MHRRGSVEERPQSFQPRFPSEDTIVLQDIPQILYHQILLSSNPFGFGWQSVYLPCQIEEMQFIYVCEFNSTNSFQTFLSNLVLQSFS